MFQGVMLLQLAQKGGWVILFLLLLSVVVFAVWADRWQFFKKHLQPLKKVWGELEPKIEAEAWKEALEKGLQNGSFLAWVAAAGIKAKLAKEKPEAAMEREAKGRLIQLEARLPLLATIGSLAPFIGLFGTVLGIINAFKDLAAANSGGAGVVSEGIAEALIATASGLFVAITAVFVFNLFQARLNVAAQEAEILISQLAEKLDA
ncbi:MAG TPA: MotA/TolQ/ExbB proton channel family protein [bacterium]|nr:MotA/TolQ/ExbB proton channel family protein [bacterium]